MGKKSWTEEEGFFSFRTMISPGLIKLLYVLGAIGITIAGVLTIIGALEARRGLWGSTEVMWGGILWGVAIIVLGNLLWRVFCEGLIVLFNIHDLLDSIDRRFRSFSLSDGSSIREMLNSIVKELKGGASRLISLEDALKEGLQQIQRAQPPSPPPTISESEEKPPEQAPPQSQQAQPPEAKPPPSLSLSRAPKGERPRARRHWGRWAFLFLLLAIGVFVALPIVSDYTKPQGLEPQAISKFLIGIWDYWAQVVRGLR
ncbi:TPA: DUF4282 domain-containing protein [Candidatus Bipolaricaulota bacterium]|nr:DUF4282 domain-containing protein [Candidatus Bipolaricaulota bacterium]